MDINDIMVSEHFNLREFACPCCNRVMLSKRLLQRLEAFREMLGLPIVITSGYRCERHNQMVGGIRGSYHTKGMAADVVCPPDKQALAVSIARKVGFKGIGIYQKEGFLHLDVRDTVEPVIWLGGKRNAGHC